MNGLMRKAGMGAVLAATVLTAAAPSDAQRWGRGGYRHGGGGNVAAGAILGGIVGLGVGAAIADSHRGYYDRGYYDRGYYYDVPPPPPPVYRGYGYDDGYYQPRCWNTWRWDPYYGRNVPARVCE